MAFWECPECGSDNAAAVSVCEFCTSERGTGLVALAQGTSSDDHAGTVRQGDDCDFWECSDCCSSNPATLSMCEFCDTPHGSGFVARAQVPELEPSQVFHVDAVSLNKVASEEELAISAREWADARREVLVDELHDLQFCSLEHRKQRLRGLQLELHPDKQPPEAGVERRIQSQALFLMVQREWEAGGEGFEVGVKCNQSESAQDLHMTCIRAATAAVERCEEFAAKIAASQSNHTQTFSNIGVVRASHVAKQAANAAQAFKMSKKLQGTRGDESAMQLLKEEEGDDLVYSNLKDAAQRYASRLEAKQRLWQHRRKFRDQGRAVEISVKVMSTLYTVSSYEQWMLYDIKEALEELCGIPAHRQNLVSSVHNHLDDSQQIGDLTSEKTLILTTILVSQKNTDYIQVAKAVREDWTSIQHVSAALQADRTIVRAAMRQCWKAINYASHEFLSDHGLFLIALKQDPYALLVASSELRSEAQLVTLAVRCDWQLLGCVAHQLYSEPSVIMSALASDARALSFATNKLLTDRDFCMKAVKMNGTAYQYTAAYWRSDVELLIEALKSDGSAIDHASPSLAKHPKVSVLLQKKEATPYIVMHDSVTIHVAPHRGSRVMAVRKKGDCITAASHSGSWLRLSGRWHPLLDQDEVLEQFGTTAAWVSGTALQPVPDNFHCDIRLALRLGETQSLACSRLRSGHWPKADRQTAVSVHAPGFGIEARWDPSWVVEEGAHKSPPIHVPSWRVFAIRPFQEGELVESCPLLPIQDADRMSVEQSMCVFSPHLVFDDERRSDTSASVPLGYGMLYRRAAPNASALKLRRSADGYAVTLLAQARLEPGEELLLPADGFRSLPPFKLRKKKSSTPETFGIDTSCQEFQPLRYSSTGVTAGAVHAGKSSVHGNGVFALQKLAPDTVIELCPVIVLKMISDANVVSDYVMSVPLTPANKVLAKVSTVNILALGCGAVYNHREHPTVAWEYIPHLGGGGFLVMTTRCEVEAGNELFISYGSGYWNGR